MQATIRQFATFGYQAGTCMHDSTLQVDICYLTLRGATTVELIHQHNIHSLEVQLLKAYGVLPYHLAYEATDFDNDCADLDARGYERLFNPVRVSVLNNIRICYFHHPAIGYIELLEQNH